MVDKRPPYKIGQGCPANASERLAGENTGQASPDVPAGAFWKGIR